MKKPAPKGGYRPELDGLRAVAVGAVILDHANIPVPFSALGMVGVTAFFVLSGYLITGILEGERERTGRVDLRRFYLRRVARLAPALLLVVGFVILLGIAGVWVRPWQGGAAASLLYVSNWAQIAGLDAGPMGHAWSLSIEEQFYAVWPLVLLWLPARKIAVVGCLGGLTLYLLTLHGMAYFSTFTNGGALLAGCALSLYRPRIPRLAGAVGFALCALSFLVVLEPLAVAGAVLIIGSGTLVLSPLAAMGRRAYGLYLWNWPLSVLLGLWAIPLTFVAAEVSYRLLERPILRRAHGHAIVASPMSDAKPEAPPVTVVPVYNR